MSTSNSTLEHQDLTTQAHDKPQPPARPAGVMGFYLVAVMSMLVSIDTSWRYFAQNLHITDLRERIVMFAVIEVALIACGYGMRANVIRSGRPGAPRLFAWVLCGMAGYMAWQLSGVAEGIARVALGPALGLVMLHLALGIEIRAGRHTTTAWARIGRELRERVLSRLGLADDTRDALAHTRDRAARRVARLSLSRVVLFRSVRLARALRASNVAHDPAARDRMLTELAAIRHAADLATLDQRSPWQTTPVGALVNTPVNAPVNGAVDAAVNAPVNTAGRVAAPIGETVTARSLNAPQHRAVHGRGPARKTVRKPQPRRKLADYVTEASLHMTPGVVVTPAWVREVIPGCPRSTSKNVADALNRQRQDDPAAARGTSDAPADALDDRDQAEVA